MRRLQIKFPNQIRISGWDFGSSARAMNQTGGKDSLMTYESVSVYRDLTEIRQKLRIWKDVVVLNTQAALGKSSKTTNERKKMSTKTSIKRIALVAVAALGFGTLNGVAANASELDTSVSLASSYTELFTPSQGANVFAVTAASSNATATVNGTTKTFTAINTFAAGDSVTVAGTTNFNGSFTVLSATPTSFTVTSVTTAATANETGLSATATSAATAVNTAVSAARTTTGYAIVQYASPTGYTKLVPNVATVASTSSVTASFPGASSVTLTPASVQFVLSDNGASLQPITVTASATISGTSFTAATDGNIYLKASAIYGAVTTSAAAFPISQTPFVAALAAAYPSYNRIRYLSSTTSDASIKVATTSAGVISGSLTKTVLSVGVSAPTLAELFTINVLPGATASTYSYAKVTAANGTGAFIDTNGLGKSFATKVSDTGNLAITVTAYDTSGAQLSNATNAPELIYSVTGVGLLNASGGLGTTYIKVPAQSWVSPNSSVTLSSDGRTGNSTVTVTAGGVTVGTISAYFYGKVASVTAVPFYTIGRASSSSKTTGSLSTIDTADITTTNPRTTVTGINGFKTVGTSNDVAIAVILKDASGNIVPEITGLSASSSNGSVILPGIQNALIDDGQGNGAAGFGYIHTTFATAPGATSGAKANLTYSYLNSDGTIVSSTPVALSVGGSVSKEVMSLDASSYEPGAPMVLTITATDSAGNPVYDGATGPALSASKMLGGTLPSAGTYVGGKIANKANKLFAPAAEGDFTIFGVGTDADTTALSVSATVSGAGQAAIDAANEATDAANAATDAANAAAEAADAATAAAQDAQAAVAELATKVAALFASIKAQITSLTNLIIKIQKKLKA